MYRLAALSALLLTTALAACSGTHERREAAASAPPRVAPVLDVPALVGLSIDEISQRLGPGRSVGTTFVDPVNAPLLQQREPSDSLRLFHYQALRLMVAYDYRSRHVRDLLLLGTDEERLMQQAHLRLQASRYLLLPVFEEQRLTALLGLRVVPTVAAD